MKISTHEFNNGFKIVYQKSSNQNPITCINAFCDAGPIYEDAESRGISHLIEHMCYKGTNHISRHSLLSQIDKTGTYINAMTSKRYTCYVVNCENKYAKSSIMFLSDIMLNSTFIKNEFLKEHRVIVEENIKDREDNMYILSNMNEKLIYKGTPFEFPIDTLEYHKPGDLKHANVVKTYNQFYIPANMLISIVSNLSLDFFIKLIKKTYFYNENNSLELQTHKLEILRKGLYTTSHSPSQSEIQYHIKNDPKIKIVNLCVSFRTCSQYSEDKYILELLSNLMGGYFSSKLATILREENGLTYSNNVSSSNNEFMGDFTIISITDSSKFIKNGNRKGVLPIIIDILNGLIRGNITQSELDIAKSNLNGKYILELNNIDRLSLYNGEQAVMFPNEKIIPYQNIYDRFYKSITLTDINRVINKYFTIRNMNVCVLGQITVAEKTIRTICERLIHI